MSLGDSSERLDQEDGKGEAADVVERVRVEGVRDGRGWGGLMLQGSGEEVPICKHLLACLLAEWWNVAEGMVEERVVGRGEMAGWAAGWGG